MNKVLPQARATPFTIPAPVGGWNAKDALSALPPYDCVLLDNWVVRSQVLQTRKGASDWVTGFPDLAVSALFPYTGAQKKLFASCGTAVYDVTNPGTVGSPVISALSSPHFRWTNFSNSAGQFLLIVNGADALQTYNGTSWTSVPNLGSLSTSSLHNITVYKNRLFFLQNDSSVVWYLPAGAISGTATPFYTGQVLRRGGSLVGIGSWSLDAGDGLDDRLVLVSSEGEVLVYTGTDPGDATNWSLLGVYYVGRPVSNRCLIKFAGDLLLLTDRGLFPLSEALSTATLQPSVALTNQISQAFAEVGSTYFNTAGWDLAISTQEALLLITIPASPSPIQFVMDLLSRRWSRFTGWPIYSIVPLEGELYGGQVGKVVKLQSGSTDFGNEIRASLITSPSFLGTLPAARQLQLLRLHLRIKGPTRYGIVALPNYSVELPPDTPYIAGLSGVGQWDSGVWDQSLWGGDRVVVSSTHTLFSTPARALSLGLVLTSSSGPVELVAMEGLYHQGSLF